MEKYYRFAGIEVAVDIPDEIMYEDDRALTAFRVDAVSEPQIFRFAMTDRLKPPEGNCVVSEPAFRLYQEGEKIVQYIGSMEKTWENAYIRTVSQGMEHDVQLERNRYRDRVGVHTVLNVLRAEHLIARKHGFVFHCSYIEHNGRAILFTAHSGTGKSTQAELWNRHRGSQIINGDRTAVRLVDGQLMAEGIPFAGSSRYCKNRSLPLEAIVYLSQAPETTIRKLRGYEAFARIWEGVSVNTWDRTDMELVSDVVQLVARSVPVYHLACTPDESAVVALEQALESR